MDGASASSPIPRRRIIILGAAGRDYHLLNTCYRIDDRPSSAAIADGAARDGTAAAAPPPSPPKDLVVAFTHSQIPHIAASRYPASLCRSPFNNNDDHYPDGIPIFPEADLERAIAETRADACVFAYSDVSFEQLGALANRVRRAGADFILPAAGAGFSLADNKSDPSTLKSKKPVVAVTAVRTGCGKSQVCALVCRAARKHGLKVALCRHPMPYGDLVKMRVQRFETLEDLDAQDATVEEREEYEQHIKEGVIVYAGVDYRQILETAEREADVVLWDGGNNDTPFFAPDLDICVADPFRPRAHETHYPGGINFARAGHLVVNKANTAPKEGVETVLAAALAINPNAKVHVTASRVTLLPPEGGAGGKDLPLTPTPEGGKDGAAAAASTTTTATKKDPPQSLIRGKRVLCVDDGPTITHGGMAEGAAVVGAREAGALEVVDPRPFFRGALKEALLKYPHIGRTVPALGYGKEQIADLAATIRTAVEGTWAEAVLVATPTDLARVLGDPSLWSGGAAVVRAGYAVEDVCEGDGGGSLAAMLDAWFAERRRELAPPASS